jgi:tetratricopeptide (TPR) repeat protein
MSEQEAARVFADGREFAVRGGGARAHARLLDVYAAQRGLAGTVGELTAYNAEALELAASVDDPALTLALAGNQNYGLFLAARLQEAHESADRAAARAMELGLVELRSGLGFHVIANCVLIVGASLLWMGKLGEARAALEESLTLASRHGDPDTTCFAHYFLVECWAGLGDAEAALRHGRAGVEVARTHQSHYSSVLTDWALARALLETGDPDGACTLLESALTAAREQRVSLNHEGALLQQLAEARLLTGEVERARETCGEAIAAAQHRGTLVWECDAWLVLARVLLRASVAEPAATQEIVSALERAQELIERTGAESRRPRLAELRAELAHTLGDAAGRERHLREAHRLYTEMGATGHTERLGRELG